MPSTILIAPYTQALSTCPSSELRALQVIAVTDINFNMTNLKRLMKALKWNSAFINTAWRDQLRSLGVLTNAQYKMGLEINPIIREALCQQASTANHYALMIKTANTILKLDTAYGYDAVVTEQRQALYEGKSAQIRKILSTTDALFSTDHSLPKPFKDLSHFPLNFAWLKTLDADIQFQILHHIVRNITRQIEFYSPPLDEIRIFLERAPDILKQPQGASLLAAIHLWQGNLAQAKQALPHSDDPSVLTMEGRITFFRGQDSYALICYDNAINKLRSTSKRRTATLTAEDQLFALLACLRSNNTDRFHALAHEFQRYNKKNREPNMVIIEWLSVIMGAREQRQTIDATMFNHFANNNINNLLFIAYGLHWLGLLSKYKKEISSALVSSSHYAQCHRMHWMRWEIDNLFQHLKPQPNSGTLSILEPFCQYDPSFPAAIRQQIKASGMVSCLDLFPPQQPWQRGLQALKALTQPITNSTEHGREQRMAWIVTIKDQTLHDISPRHQTITKNGRWGKGRKIALQRLLSPSEPAIDFPFMSEQDQRMCAWIRESQDGSGYYYEGYYDFDGYPTLQQAVGHPLLFLNEATTPLTIHEDKVVLHVIEEKQGIRICLHPYPLAETTAERPLFQWDTPQQLTLFFFTKEQCHIAKILGEEGLLVPTSAQEEALESIAAIAPLLTVHSAVEGAGQQAAQEVEADSRLHLQMQPMGAGLQINCLVRPFAESSLALRPGEGGHTVFTEHEGVTLQARRDLPQEIKHSQTLLTTCSHLDAEEGWRWSLDDPQQTLETLEQLQQLGDTQVVLEWPEGKKIALSQKLNLGEFRISMQKQQDWFEMEGEVTINDDQVISIKKLLSLVSASPGRFVRLADDQFLSLSNALYQRLSALQSVTDKGRFHGLAAGAIEEITDGMKVRKNKHWQDHLQSLTAAQDYNPQLPTTLQAELRDYQQEGFAWMARLTHWGAGACLADDMGLGKTVQALALMLLHAPSGPILVVAPTSVCMNWESEAARFAPTLKLHNFADCDREQVINHAGPFDIVVCSYALLQRNSTLLTSRQWQMVALDEAQAIKNGFTKRSKAAMALQAKVRIVTTGTPIENHLGELWNLFQFVNPGLLGSLDSFNRRFAYPIESEHDKTVAKRLKQLIHPFILRRLKSDVLTELPPRTEITIHVELSSEEMALYEATRQIAMERIAESSDEGNGSRHLKVLAEIMRLRRVCCHPSLIMPSSKIAGSKLAAFADCINELREGNHKALVFSQFVGHLTILRNYLDGQKIPYQYLDGATPAATRKKRVDAFQAGEGDLFLISLKAGGSGLNLTAADFVLHMDPWWNPAVEDQASDRAHRIGQTRPVTIYRFIAKNTIEDKIVQLHQQKRDLADSLLEGSDSGGKMSLQEIMKLVEENEIE